MTTFGHKHDHMDALNRYKDYKKFWDRHRIPGEYKDKKLLWIDTGYQTFREKHQSGFAKKKNANKVTVSKKSNSIGSSVTGSVSSKSNTSTPTLTAVNRSRTTKQMLAEKHECGEQEITTALDGDKQKEKLRRRKDSCSSRSSADSEQHKD